MRKIEAIIRPTKLHEVIETLEAAGFESLKGIVQQWRGREYCVDLLPKTKIEVIVSEERTEEVIDVIIKIAATGNIGDGKIFVYPVEKVVRIRTGERDGDAL
jgi:nitrogen regulatory protein P-II 1